MFDEIFFRFLAIFIFRTMFSFYDFPTLISATRSVNCKSLFYSVFGKCLNNFTDKSFLITTSPPKVIWEERVALAQLRNNVPLVTVGRPKFTPKTALPFDDHHPHLIHPSLNRPHSPSQMASGSTQPFRQITTTHLHINSNKSSQSHLGRAGLPPLMAENGLSSCVC